MAEQTPKRKQLLFVDDDPDCLSTITALLKRMSNGEWAMRTATNHSLALELLKAQPVDVIVLDVQMPVMDGVEFLRLLSRTHPGQQVVMLTGRVDETTRKTALDLGAALFLEKPVSPAGFQAVHAALDALLSAGTQSGFRGVMQLDLQDVLQMECLARKSSILTISTGERKGQIYICEGEIVHAQHGQLRGEMALYGLLALRGGQFTMEPFTEPPQRTICGQYQFLLMEAARLRDENGSDSSKRPASDRHELGLDSPETQSATPARGVRMDEVLLSSTAGEVLYQSKCAANEKNLALIKELEQQTMRASKGLPSGRFHRVTLEQGNRRVVIQIQPTFNLLVRSDLPALSTPNE
ncbi:MAG TPA: response regulator [Candidatus Dormibacteraeota bacterium]|nr:response regulator [Candidatus Dormibacteraeota bacterium]